MKPDKATTNSAATSSAETGAMGGVAASAAGSHQTSGHRASNSFDPGRGAAQFTLRATLVGALLGIPLAVANLYTLLHIGWSFGVNITACLVGFAIWQALRGLSGGRASALSELESVSLQATASAAGYATGSTAAIAFGAMLLLTEKRPDPWVMFAVTVLTGVLGVLLAIPLRAWLIDAEKLPFPSGAMTATTIRGIAARTVEALRSARILLTSLVFGLLLGSLRALQQLMGGGALPASWSGFFEKRAPAWLLQSEFALPYAAPGLAKPIQIVGFAFEPSFLLIGAGMIVGLRITLSMIAAALLLYFGLVPMLISMTDATGAPALPPVGDGIYEARRWAVWPGTTLLLAATLTGFLLELPRLLRSFFATSASNGSTDDSSAPPLHWTLVGVPIVAVLLGAVLSLGLNVPVIGVVVSILMAGFAAAIAARVTGETDNTPTGPVIKLAQAGAALTVRGDLTTNVLCGGVAGGAAMSAADLLQDMKTGRILGANLRTLVFSQLLGAVVGAATIVPVFLFALYPSAAAIKEKLPPPIMISATAARVFAEGIGSIPASAQSASLYALFAGIGLAVLAKAWPQSRGWLPSAAGLGMGWILPFSAVLAFAIGALIAAIWTLIHPRHAEQDQVATASGLVAGESLMAALGAIILAVVALRQVGG
ncbi:MAG: OPT/YSL family transporter [Phycisphaerae bacterium]|nr:OPT/YSL family transporter [Phycisphaerae bacterium]